MQHVDNQTIESKNISSYELMERASKACSSWILDHFQDRLCFHVICGMGNNGGDGLAIARHLYENNKSVVVSVIQLRETGSADFEKNLIQATARGIEVHFVTEIHHLRLVPDSIVIDALFGYGLSRPVTGLCEDVIQEVNRSKNLVISIDMPSGLFAEPSMINSTAVAIHAAYTLTFEAPKLALLLPDFQKITGKLIVLPIGLDADAINQQDSDTFWVGRNFAKQCVRARNAFDHKGIFGHATLIAGMKGKMGAAVLAARACLRSGAGLVTVHIPNIGYSILQQAIPEAMVDSNPGEDFLIPTEITTTSAIGIGPGIGKKSETLNLLTSILQHCDGPMVLDADALNLLSENKELLRQLPSNCILTPHPKEFERLVGRWSSDVEKLELMKEFAKTHSCYLLVKGAYSVMATPEGSLYFNSTGNPGMATGGSGDVLTGILTGLLAQGYQAKDAMILGVHLHGLAGDIAAQKQSMEALIASDIIEHIGTAYQTLAT